MKGHQSPDVSQTLNKLVNNYEFNTILDIGCGRCNHTNFFKNHGKNVTSTDLAALEPGVIAGDYMKLKFDQHDAVWCSHVLEHQLNVQEFLHKLISECKEGGVIAITVPPLKHQIVGGHISFWNTGLLLYRMILAGLDCSEARVGTYGYNCSVIVSKKSIEMPQDLTYGNGDIEKLSKYFPMAVKQGFNGQNVNVRWK